MSITYATRLEAMKSSDIREILKVTSRPDVISFAGGLPAVETFPVEDMVEITRAVMEEHGGLALQYSTTEGFPRLRNAIARRMNEKRGTRVSGDEVLITSGSQQGLDMTGKFIYVIPDFQNPTGRTWSLERRYAFMELVNRYRVPVIEDAPYADVRFEGVDLMSLKSFDTEGLVIHLGTFSKTFCPGMRLAWLVADPEIGRKYTMVKQGTDLHTSTYGQLLLCAFMERGRLDTNIERIRELYRERRDVMLEAIDRYFPREIRTTRPEGGLFLWVELPEGMDARSILERSLTRKVAFVPGGSFFPNGGRENTFRMNFSAMPPERIVEGVKRLAGVLVEEGQLYKI